jgi:hypothetical protein
LELDEGFFVWLHPTELDRALFMVDDVAKRAMGEATTQSHEGVRATLSKLGEVATMVALLGMEAQCQMINEVVV